MNKCDLLVWPVLIVREDLSVDYILTFIISKASSSRDGSSPRAKRVETLLPVLWTLCILLYEPSTCKYMVHYRIYIVLMEAEEQEYSRDRRKTTNFKLKIYRGSLTGWWLFRLLFFCVQNFVFSTHGRQVLSTQRTEILLRIRITNCFRVHLPWNEADFCLLVGTHYARLR